MCSRGVAPCPWIWKPLCLDPAETDRERFHEPIGLCRLCVWPLTSASETTSSYTTLHSLNTHSWGPSVRSFWMYWNMWKMMSSTCTAVTHSLCTPYYLHLSTRCDQLGGHGYSFRSAAQRLLTEALFSQVHVDDKKHESSGSFFLPSNKCVHPACKVIMTIAFTEQEAYISLHFKFWKLKLIKFNKTFWVMKNIQSCPIHWITKVLLLKPVA